MRDIKKTISKRTKVSEIYFVLETYTEKDGDIIFTRNVPEVVLEDGRIMRGGHDFFDGRFSFEEEAS